MPNLEAIINSHNKKILESGTQPQVEPCDCRSKTTCPIKDQSCRTQNVVYKATVNTPAEVKTYIGLSSTEFKVRYRNHKSSFKDPKKKKKQQLWPDTSTSCKKTSNTMSLRGKSSIKQPFRDLAQKPEFKIGIPY